MYKIGEFSRLAKTTVKTLRYYEREGLLKPAFVDESLYRYYTAKQLLELGRIVNLRQMGFSIEEIKQVFAGADFRDMLSARKTEIENQLAEYGYQLSKVNYALEELSMKYEPVVKQLPECIMYYKEGVIDSIADASAFITGSGEECLALNPGIKCVEPDYCFVNYLDKEYRESNVKLRYCQAVTEAGVESKTIKFKKLESVKAVCIYHKGSYETLGEAYGFIMNYLEENGYEAAEYPRECYIDGIWNKEDPADWLTEIQVPIK
ncbi:MAG: MerR family transcriptional regulator [Bacillota bacterium]|nr:MerR family transcriptional regulator [Bacillota bacterium]